MSDRVLNHLCFCTNQSLSYIEFINYIQEKEVFCFWFCRKLVSVSIYNVGSILLLLKKINISSLPSYTAWKVSKYGVNSGPLFPVFGLNTEIYLVNLRIQSEYRKIRTRNNSVFGHFSSSVSVTKIYPPAHQRPYDAKRWKNGLTAKILNKIFHKQLFKILL